jgi:hypothetical protein
MLLRRHKVRVVSRRFTQDEYEAITKACEAEETCSLSEFARMGMKERLALSQLRESRIEADAATVSKRLEKVYQELRAMSPGC